MNKQRITEIISSPGNLQYSSDLPLVKELIESFPYFPTPYVMLSKMLHDENSIYFDKNLKISAAYIGNREILYNYIHQKNEKTESPVPEIDKAPKEESYIAADTPILELHKEEIKSEEAFTGQVASHIPNMEIVTDAEQIPAIVEDKPEPKSSKRFQEFGNDVLQYPVTDYFGQYYKKGNRSIESKEIIRTEPAEDTTSGKKSFTAWLDLLETRKTSTESRETTKSLVPETGDRGDVNDLINKFIHTEPKIKQQQSRMYKPEDMARQSVMEDHNIATETLANIYLKQGLKPRAVEIFQQLILKFPEKSNYFAARIKEIQSEGSY